MTSKYGTALPAITLMFALTLSGCGSYDVHRVSDEELSPEWSGKAFSDLLVIGVYEDRSYRVSAKTTFVERLKEQGITASTSYELMPDLSNLKNNSAIAEQLMTRSHDAVLVVATLDPGYDYDIGDYFETRGMVYLLGGEPGAATDMGSFIAWAGSGFYSLYVGLWDAKAGKAVWQISTDSESTGSESTDTQELADFVAEQLRSKGLL